MTTTIKHRYRRDFISVSNSHNVNGVARLAFDNYAPCLFRLHETAPDEALAINHPKFIPGVVSQWYACGVFMALSSYKRPSAAFGSAVTQVTTGRD